MNSEENLIILEGKACSAYYNLRKAIIESLKDNGQIKMDPEYWVTIDGEQFSLTHATVSEGNLVFVATDKDGVRHIKSIDDIAPNVGLLVSVSTELRNRIKHEYRVCLTYRTSVTVDVTAPSSSEAIHLARLRIDDHEDEIIENLVEAGVPKVTMLEEN